MPTSNIFMSESEQKLNPQYLQGIVSQQTAAKQPVRVATTAAIAALGACDLTGADSDGVSLDVRDRVLVKDQADPKQNGIYYVSTAGAAGVLTRAEDMDEDDETQSGSEILVREGAVGAGIKFRLETAAGGETLVVGTDNLTFSQVKGDAASGSVATADLANGALSADAAGRAKMAAGYFGLVAASIAHFVDGFWTEAAVTAKFAAQSITTAILKAGILSADAAGRALVAAGFFDAATVLAKFAAKSITGDKLALAHCSAPAADLVASGAGAVSAAFAAKATIAADRLLASSKIRIRAWGKVDVGGGAINVQLTPRIGAVAIGGQTTAIDPADEAVWSIEAEVIVASIGAAGTFNSFLQSMVGTQQDAKVAVASAVDTTVARDVDVLVDWGAGAGESIQLLGLTVEVIN